MDKQNLLIRNPVILKVLQHSRKCLPDIGGIHGNSFFPHHTVNRLCNIRAIISISVTPVMICKNKITLTVQCLKLLSKIVPDALLNYFSSSFFRTGNTDSRKPVLPGWLRYRMHEKYNQNEAVPFLPGCQSHGMLLHMPPFPDCRVHRP